jgi:TonB family protein
MKTLDLRKTWPLTASLFLIGFSIFVLATSTVAQTRPLIFPTSVLQSDLLDQEDLRADKQEWRYACTHGDVQAVYDYFNSSEQVLTISHINYRPLSLPSPSYPKLARTAGVTGSVNVMIVVDESGRVIYSRALSGPLLLSAAAEKVACQALFTPPTLSGAAMRVSDTIVYNFTLIR